MKLLSDNIDLEINNRIKKLIELGKQVYTVKDHDNKIYAHNPRSLISGFDFGCVSPWNSVEGDRRAATLLTPWVVGMAKHYGIPVDGRVRFVTGEGLVEERRIDKRAWIDSGFSLVGTDIMLGRLDSPILNIAPAQILPQNFADYIDIQESSIPVITFDREEKVSLTRLIRDIDMPMVRLANDTAEWKPYYESKIVGDSSNPMFIIIGKQPVLLGFLTYGGVGSGTSLTYRKDALDELVEFLGVPEGIVEANLDNFIALNELRAWTELNYENLVGCEYARGKVLRFKPGKGWDSGGTSVQAFDTGTFKIIPSQADRYLMVGISSDGDSPGYRKIEYAFQFRNNGTIWIYENGSKQTEIGGYEGRDEFFIDVSEDFICYRAGAHVVREVLRPAGRKFKLDFSIYNHGAMFEAYQLYGAPEAQ